MADLDKLQIEVAADTKKATTAIDALIKQLGNLSDAFNVKGMDGFVTSLRSVASAINNINTNQLNKIANSMGSLKKATSGLAHISDNANKTNDSVTRLGKKLADIANITDKKGVSMLTDSLREFLNASNSSEFTAARNKILNVAKTFGSVGSEIDKDRERAKQFLAELDKTKINLPMDWTKEYADSAEGKRIRGMIGNFSRTVSSGGSDADDVAKNLGIGDYNNAQDAFKAIASQASIMRDIVDNTDDYVTNLGDALRMTGEQGREAAESMQAFTQALANAVGLTSNQLKDTFGMDGFLGEDFEQQNIAMETFTQNAERLKAQGNPFQNIIDGLNELTSTNMNDTLVTYLYSIKEAASSIGGRSGQNAGEAMKRISEGLQSLEISIPGNGYQIESFAKSLRKLGSGNIVSAAQALPFVAQGLEALNGVNITTDNAKITELAKAVAGFGYAKVEKAIVNLPTLTNELVRLINALSKAPEVSQNTVELVKALGNLNTNALRTDKATRRAGQGLDIFTKKTKRAKSASFSLAAAIGKIYASYWMVLRAIGMFKNSIDLASDLTETQNVVDQTFGQMKYAMEDFAKTAVETVGMNELTAKKIGSRYQGMVKAMAISPEMVRSATEFTDKATNGYSKVSDKVADLSINMTKLAGDMASFYNLDYEDVAEDLEAVMTGMTRPMRKYGIDLTVASMKEFALANGLNADIKNMSNAEKTMLRYQMVMARTTAAQNDFIKTQDTWANQSRIAAENLKRLQIILGQIGIYSFKPLVKSFNSAMNDILHLAESTFNSLGTIFGWEVEITDVGIVDDLADGMDDVSDGIGDAADEAKKFKNFLLGIDELNLLPDTKDKNGNDGADTIGAMANDLEDSAVKMRKTEKGFDSIYDTLFKLGRRIGEVQLDWLKGIDWDDIYKKAESAGKGLASFLNGYLADAELFYHKGRFIANGINTVAHAIYGFFHEFEGYQYGKDLGFELNGFNRSLDWDIIKGAAYEMSHDLTEIVNGFFENVNWNDVGRTIIEGINTAVLFVSTLWNEIHWDIIGRSLGDALNGMVQNWDHEEMARLFHGKIKALFDLANSFLDQADFVEFGHTIGQFLSELHLEEFADDIAVLVWNLIKAAFELLPTMFAEAPLETSLIMAFAGAKFTGFGNSFGSMLAGAMKTGLSGAGVGSSLGSVIAMDLDAIVTSGSLLVQATAIGEAIAGAIVAAWAGYNFGLKLHDIIFEGDEMWSEQGAIVEAVKNITWWDDAFGQMVTDLKTNVEYYDKALDSFYGINADFAKRDFGINEGMTWEDVRHSIETGAKSYTESQYEQMKEMLINSGNSNIEVNELINSLKTARDNYLNGFAPWLEDQSDIQYALKNGAQYADQILEDAYNRYNLVLEEEAELERKRDELYNSPENQRQRYNAQQERIAELNNEIEAWNGLSEAQQNFARISGQVPEHILDIQKPDAYEKAGKALTKFAGDAGSFARNTTNALQTAVNGLFKFDYSVSASSSNAVGAIKEMEDAFGHAGNMGSGLFTGEVRNIENLNTKLILTGTGLERITTAIDEIGNKKDKTRTLHEAFDGVKGKVEEVGNLFTMENMDNMFSAIPKAFRMAWQDAVNILKSVWAEMANWINQNAQLEIPKVKVGNNDYGGQKVRIQVPRFDVGGSIPNNGNLFFANESGAEVVANMGSRTGVMNTDQMETAIANGMMKALAANGQNVTVVLEGDASSFFSAMVKENNNAIMRVGASPLRV